MGKKKKKIQGTYPFCEGKILMDIMPFGDMEKNTTLKQRCSQKKALDQGYHCKTQNKGYHELNIHVDHEFLDGVALTLTPYILSLHS